MEKRVSLADFTEGWNSNHDSVKIMELSIGDIRSIICMDDNLPELRPVGVSVRFDPIKHRKYYSYGGWAELEKKIEKESKGLLFITSSQNLFEKGVIELAIASAHPKYNEIFLISALKWLGEVIISGEHKI